MSSDLKIRTSKFKVGGLVYWRRNAGKKVESVWKGPGVIIEAKSDTTFVVKSRRKVMHHDKLSLKPAETGLYMGTWKRVRERAEQSEKPKPSKRPKATTGTNTRQYCVCLQSNPEGLMVQCDSCQDWFHPGCVGISEDYAKTVPQYICPECSPVDVGRD